MAQHFFGINYGDDTGDGVVTTGTSDTSKDVQIVTLDGQGLTRVAVKLLAERLIRYVEHEDSSSVFSG